MLEEETDFKKQREQFTINIRKNNREQLLNKRRNLSNLKDEHDHESMEGQENKTILIVDDRYKQQIEQFIKADYDESEFDTLSSLLSSSDIIEQHRGLIGIRRLISKNVDPPISKFVDRNLIYICISLAKQKEYPQLKLEATWCLTNVASGSSEFCSKIYEKGGIELFVNLLKENSKGIVDQAIWGIGNIAVDDYRYRDEILERGGMEALIKVIESSENKNIIKNGTWAVTNLCRGNPPPKYLFIKEASPFLCKIIKSQLLEANKEVLSDAVWTLSFMTEGNKSRVEKVHNENVLHLFFKYATDNYTDLSVPAIKTIGNFSNGNENHAQALIDNGIFDLALILLNHPKRQIRMEISWILSNMAAGIENQVKQFMSRKDLLDKIAVLFNTDTVEIRKEICWIYSNFAHLGDKETLIELCLHYDIMRIYANLLNEEDPRILENVLETLNKLLLVSKKCLANGQNRLLVQLLSNGGGEKLENLQRHPNKKVYELTIRILTKFFEMEDQII